MFTFLNLHLLISPIIYYCIKFFGNALQNHFKSFPSHFFYFNSWIRRKFGYVWFRFLGFYCNISLLYNFNTYLVIVFKDLQTSYLENECLVKLTSLLWIQKRILLPWVREDCKYSPLVNLTLQNIVSIIFKMRMIST